jgi:hypothetical protein
MTESEEVLIPLREAKILVELGIEDDNVDMNRCVLPCKLDRKQESVDSFLIVRATKAQLA